MRWRPVKYTPRLWKTWSHLNEKTNAEIELSFYYLAWFYKGSQDKVLETAEGV